MPRRKDDASAGCPRKVVPRIVVIIVYKISYYHEKLKLLCLTINSLPIGGNASVSSENANTGRENFSVTFSFLVCSLLVGVYLYAACLMPPVKDHGRFARSWATGNKEMKKLW